jgi:hypothetical protein
MAAMNRNILPLSCCFLFVILVVVNDVSALTTQTDNNRMLSSQVYDTILSGNIAVIPNFLPAQEILALREDAAALHTSNHFSTDALASYGSSGTFDPAKDRAVLKLDQWKNPELGHWQTRTALANRMAALRTDLAYNLNRPHMDQGDAVHKYGAGSTEISYTRFGPGAFLKRHVDEHHEEIKGLAGWSQPTRRSISWLVYLNDPVDWNPAKNGGQLRCFARKTGGVSIHNGGAGLGVGARPNGDLQIGWLRATAFDPWERPVFLDGRQEEAGKCAMYIVRGDLNNGSSSIGTGTQDYITDTFDAHPILYMAGGQTLVQKLLVNRRDLAERFLFIEPPKSRLGDILKGGQDYAGTGEDPTADEVTDDIDPIGGTLVLFDSVSLPHEVLATRGRERWATSGWFHEDQQPVEGHRSPIY